MVVVVPWHESGIGACIVILGKFYQGMWQRQFQKIVCKDFIGIVAYNIELPCHKPKTIE